MRSALAEALASSARDLLEEDHHRHVVRPFSFAFWNISRIFCSVSPAYLVSSSGPFTPRKYPLIFSPRCWALLDKPGVEDLVEYETRLDYVLVKYADPVICAYDLRRFSSTVTMDIMRTHPVVIIGGVLQENPFFVPPYQFLLELRERGSARRGPRSRTER